MNNRKPSGRNSSRGCSSSSWGRRRSSNSSSSCSCSSSSSSNSRAVLNEEEKQLICKFIKFVEFQEDGKILDNIVALLEKELKDYFVESSIQDLSFLCSEDVENKRTVLSKNLRNKMNERSLYEFINKKWLRFRMCT